MKIADWVDGSERFEAKFKEKLWKSMKFNENQWKSFKNARRLDETLVESTPLKRDAHFLNKKAARLDQTLFESTPPKRDAKRYSLLSVNYVKPKLKPFA